MQSKNVLVVEDDEAIRDTLSVALELQGYRVLTAADGQKGLDVLSQMPRPCVILLDLMMPVMDGWEFMDVLGKDTRFAKVPIVVVTAYAEKAKTLSDKTVINKPVDIEELYRVLARYCGES